MNTKLLPALAGMTILFLASTSMANFENAFGAHMNQSFYVSPGSADSFVLTTPPTIAITTAVGVAQNVQMGGGVSSGTSITQSMGAPLTAKAALLDQSIDSWQTSVPATLTYTATIGTNSVINGSVQITLDTNGNITTNTDSTTCYPNATDCTTATAACELILTPATSNAGPSYSTLVLNCGDSASALVKKHQ